MSDFINRIYYQKGFDYQLVRPYTVETGITIPHAVSAPFIYVSPGGRLTLDAGWAWDGISGARDTPDGMRGSCGHDAFYKLFRLEELSLALRDEVDDVFHVHCIEDKMLPLRADIFRGVLRILGDDAADPKNIKEVFVAPRLEVKEDKDPEYTW